MAAEIRERGRLDLEGDLAGEASVHDRRLTLVALHGRGDLPAGHVGEARERDLDELIPDPNIPAHPPLDLIPRILGHSHPRMPGVLVDRNQIINSRDLLSGGGGPLQRDERLG